MNEEKRLAYLKAKETLAGVDWLFDDFVNAETRKWLLSQPEETLLREGAYQRARVATELKMSLLSVTDTYEAEQRAAEKKAAFKAKQKEERRHGRT